MALPSVSEERLRDLCRKWRVRELSVFGSWAAGEATPSSDIDLLVSFEPDAPWSLLDLVEMAGDLETLFGRPVDLVEQESVRNPFRRKRILECREVLYAA